MSLSATLRRPVRNAVRAATVAAIAATVLALPGRAHAVTISMQALTSFGSSGWLAPAAFPTTTGTGDRIRSIAFNPVSGNLLYASGTSVYSMSSTSGSNFTELSNSGVSGGSASGGITRVLNTVAVTSDGIIYGGNLSTNTGNVPFKVYRWASAASTPTVSYTGNAGLANIRVGDDIAVNGTDTNGLLGFGYGSGVTSGTFTGVNSNGFATVTTGGTGTATGVTPISGSPAPANGQFRLGMAFVNSTSVIGTQNSAILASATFSGATGVLVSSTTLPNGGSQRGVGYGTAYGVPLLATIDTGNNAVRLYNATNLASPTLLSTLNLTTGTNSNTNGTAQVVFGSLSGQPVLYALNSNNGIQAFQIVPEPSTTLAAGVCTVGLAGLMLRGRRRSQDA